jgi:hypothetical protein
MSSTLPFEITQTIQVHDVFWRTCRSFPPDTLLYEFTLLTLFVLLSSLICTSVSPMFPDGEPSVENGTILHDDLSCSKRFLIFVHHIVFYSSIRPTSGLILCIYPQLEEL